MSLWCISSGTDPGEVKRVNFHPPFSEPPSFFLFSLIPQILIGSNTLLQKFTPHFKILDPRLLVHYFHYFFIVSPSQFKAVHLVLAVYAVSISFDAVISLFVACTYKMIFSFADQLLNKTRYTTALTVKQTSEKIKRKR